MLRGQSLQLGDTITRDPEVTKRHQGLVELPKMPFGVGVGHPLVKFPEEINNFIGYGAGSNT